MDVTHKDRSAGCGLPHRVAQGRKRPKRGLRVERSAEASSSYADNLGAACMKRGSDRPEPARIAGGPRTTDRGAGLVRPWAETAGVGMQRGVLVIAGGLDEMRRHHSGAGAGSGSGIGARRRNRHLGRCRDEVVGTHPRAFRRQVGNAGPGGSPPTVCAGAPNAIPAASPRPRRIGLRLVDIAHSAFCPDLPGRYALPGCGPDTTDTSTNSGWRSIDLDQHRR